MKKTMNNYRVTFIKKASDNQPEQVLGHVVIDDTGTSQHLTLEAKAFRLATQTQLIADKLRVEKL
jgi:hypothetical protein